MLDELFVYTEQRFVAESFFDLFVYTFVDNNKRAINVFSFFMVFEFQRIEQFLAISFQLLEMFESLTFACRVGHLEVFVKL